MYNLSSSQLLAIWEKGFSQSNIERAMTILAIALPTATSEDLASLTIGKRNIHLLNIREYLLGTDMNCLTRCNYCHESMEFTLNTQALKAETDTIQSDRFFTIGKKKYQFRLMTCHDLAVAAQQPNLAQAERALIACCLTTANDDGFTAAMPDFSDAVVKGLAEQLQRCEPHAQLLMHLTCPVCAKSWQTAFDIVSFLWDEIVTRAKQLLAEVHQLAQAYGWSEMEILALSSTRRQYYLNQTT